MAESGVDCDTLEKLEEKHKRERKNLQSEITKLKHSIPKGDKKRKKEVTLQIAQLEADLDATQKKEQLEFTQGINEATQRLGALNTNEDCDIPASADNPTAVKSANQKSSRAQKRRDKKDQKGKEREELIRQQEVDNLFGPRHVEAKRIKQLLKEKGLKLQEVPSDGNCLYAAVEDQLNRMQSTTSVETLRHQTAHYMRQHQDDFLPFLSHPSTGEPMSQDDFEDYCHRLETQPEWGGQLEIQALSCVLGHPIEVVQADGPVIKIGDDYKKDLITLSYHRHAYKLGEHYNSVTPVTPEDQEDDNSAS